MQQTAGIGMECKENVDTKRKRHMMISWVDRELRIQDQSNWKHTDVVTDQVEWEGVSVLTRTWCSTKKEGTRGRTLVDSRLWPVPWLQLAAAVHEGRGRRHKRVLGQSH